jgi:CheY-like chemotaxis protein
VTPRPNGTKILVVESHRRLAAGVTAVLGDDFQVEEARDARRALEVLGLGGVTMLVVDDELAAGDPFELCKTARVAEGTPGIVLLASTYLAATRVRAARSGVDELIQKPAAISEVLTRVWLCLRRRQLEQGMGQSALTMPVAEPPDLSLTLLDAAELMIAGGRTGRVARGERRAAARLGGGRRWPGGGCAGGTPAGSGGPRPPVPLAHDPGGAADRARPGQSDIRHSS